MIESPEELHSRYGPIQPKLVLCAPSSLAYGPSRDVLASTFLASRNSLVLLTSPGSPGTLASHLFDLWNDSQPSGSRYGTGKVGEVVDFDDVYGNESSRGSGGRTSIRLKMKKKQVLAGEELMAYLEEERANKEKEQKAKALAERNRRMMEADAAGNESSDSDDSDDDDDDDAQARAAVQQRKSGDAPQGVGIGPAAFAEPGSAPVLRSEKKGGISKFDSSMTATGTGAWDEFLDDSRGAQMGGFDIYVRQPARTDPAGESGMANQTKYRMFPFFERRRKVDGYGEAIDIEGWKTRNKAPEELEADAAAAAAEGALGKRKREDDSDLPHKAAEAAPEPPHKFVIQDITVQLRCKVFVVDMEGKADGRALRSILPLIEPKKLVLVNGSPEATQELAGALQSATMAQKDIFAPSVGDRTKIADVTKSFSVRLDDSLMAALALRKVNFALPTDRSVHMLMGVRVDRRVRSCARQSGHRHLGRVDHPGTGTGRYSWRRVRRSRWQGHGHGYGDLGRPASLTCAALHRGHQARAAQGKFDGTQRSCRFPAGHTGLRTCYASRRTREAEGGS